MNQGPVDSLRNKFLDFPPVFAICIVYPDIIPRKRKGFNTNECLLQSGNERLYGFMKQNLARIRTELA